MQLLETLEKLKSKYTDPIDAPQLEAWEKEVNRLLVVESVAQSDGVRMLVEQLQKEIQMMDEALLKWNSDIFPDRLRDRMLDKKELHYRVISYFDVDQSRKNLENELTSNL